MNFGFPRPANNATLAGQADSRLYHAKLSSLPFYHPTTLVNYGRRQNRHF